MNEHDLQYHLNFRAKDYQAIAEQVKQIRLAEKRNYNMKRKGRYLLTELAKYALMALLLAESFRWLISTIA